nr:Chain A, PsfC [Pseudomonas syringae]7RTY_B Chain B, PsfC [Pseudomonas syringae]
MNRKVVDTHVHLLLSKKQRVPDWAAIKRMLDVAKVDELDALCVTEHIEADGYQTLMEGLFVENRLPGGDQHAGRLTYQGVAIFPGAELELANRTNVGVHTDLEGLLALDRAPGAYTLERLHAVLEQRGRPFKLVAHHIFWPGKTCDDLQALGRYVNAIEVPAKDLANAQNYVALAETLALDTTGGSDAHTFIQVGACRTAFELPGSVRDCTAQDWISSRQTSHLFTAQSPRLVVMSNIYRQSLMG